MAKERLLSGRLLKGLIAFFSRELWQPWPWHEDRLMVNSGQITGSGVFAPATVTQHGERTHCLCLNTHAVEGPGASPGAQVNPLCFSLFQTEHTQSWSWDTLWVLEWHSSVSEQSDTTLVTGCAVGLRWNNLMRFRKSNCGTPFCNLLFASFVI